MIGRARMNHIVIALAAGLAAACATAPSAAPPAADAGLAAATPAGPVSLAPSLGAMEAAAVVVGASEPAQTNADGPAPAADAVSLTGDFIQGGLVFGRTSPGARVSLDGADVVVDAEGNFVIGFGRDSAASALLTVETPDGAVDRRPLEIKARVYDVSRVDGLDQSKVDGFTPEQLAQIERDTAKKKAARIRSEIAALWASGFDWPVTGRISGVFGSQRILNGVPKRPHSGLDIAAPTGTAIRAPADGVVTLAEGDMYFEGGLVLIDHGHWLESAFLHLSRIDVAPGQSVRKGDVIGAVGATGRATGPHLHWSLKWTGRLVDPQLLLGEMPPAK